MKNKTHYQYMIVLGVILVLFSAGASSSYAVSRGNNIEIENIRGTSNDNLNIYYIGECDTTYEPTSVDAQGDYVYVTSEDYIQSCPPTLLGALDVINIMEPSSPWVEGICEDFHKAVDVAVKDTYAYVLELPGMGYDLFSSINAVDVTLPSGPWVRYSADYGEMAPQKFSVVLQDECAFVLLNGRMDIWDIPTLSWLYSSTSTNTYARDIVVLGDYAYVLTMIYGPRHFFTIFDVSNPLYPELVHEQMISGSNGISVIDISDNCRYVYITTSNSLLIFNVTNPYNMPDSTSYDIEFGGVIKTLNTQCYLLSGGRGIVSLNISDPENPQPVGYYNSSENLTDLAVQDDYIYVITDEWHMHILQFVEDGNLPPNPPYQPIGPTEGEAGIEYTYSTNTSDLNDDQIYYMFDWGNGEFSEWLGPVNSGESIEASHIWDDPGTYQVRAQAMDVHNETSTWSEPLTVEITTPPLSINISKGFGIGITAEITILDTIPEETITWRIFLDGKLIFYPPKGEKTGSFPTPPVGATEQISTFTLGFGRFEVTVSALEISETAKGFLLGCFTLVE